MPKRLFTDRGITRGTVVLNNNGRPNDEFGYFGSAFHEAAQEAVAALRQRRSRLSGLDSFRAYPVLFMYRHALELQLKAVILEGSAMVAIQGLDDIDREDLLRTHSLEKLRQQIERVWDAHDWGWDFGVDHLRSRKDFRALISELGSVDDGSYAFRYPVDTKGKASLTSYFKFDLFEFCANLDHLLNGLNNAVTAAYEEIQIEHELQAENREFERENFDPADAYDEPEYDYEPDYD